LKNLEDDVAQVNTGTCEAAASKNFMAAFSAKEYFLRLCEKYSYSAAYAAK
jgi:hypothetical protein